MIRHDCLISSGKVVSDFLKQKVQKSSGKSIWRIFASVTCQSFHTGTAGSLESCWRKEMELIIFPRSDKICFVFYYRK